MRLVDHGRSGLRRAHDCLDTGRDSLRWLMNFDICLDRTSFWADEYRMSWGPPGKGRTGMVHCRFPSDGW